MHLHLPPSTYADVINPYFLKARLALCEILPEYKAAIEAQPEGANQDVKDLATFAPSDGELETFRTIPICDKRIYDLTNTNRLNLAAPYTIFTEYIKRHCIPERDVKAKMVPLGRNRHRFELNLGELSVKVS